MGNYINVLGRPVLLRACDPFTRSFYADVLGIEQPAPIPPPEVIKPTVTVRALACCMFVVCGCERARVFIICLVADASIVTERSQRRDSTWFVCRVYSNSPMAFSPVHNH